MPRQLTVRKQRWNPHVEPKVLRGAPLNPSAATTDRYYRALAALIHKMTADTERQIRRFFDTGHAQEYFAEDISVAAQARILTDAISRKFEKLFADLAKPIAEGMTDQVDDNSATTLKLSLRELSQGITLNTDILTGDLRDVISATITENVGLIKSIADQYLSGVQGAVMRSITTGNGLQDLVPFLKGHEGITLRRAKNIALDQTRKAYNNINKHRMQAIGIDEYEWLHSAGSQKPRKLHEQMNGNIYKLSDPPIIDLKTGERGIPGQLINCFTGDTAVSLANGCNNLWRYFHSGDVVSISLESGTVFTCTPNHPILTKRGWLPAHEIQEGDYLATSEFDSARAVDGDKAYLKTTFEKLYSSLVVAQAAEISAGSEFNFYGDIPKGQVDAIAANYPLADGVIAVGVEDLEQLILTNTDVMTHNANLRILPKVFKTLRTRIGGYANALLLGQPRHAQSLRPAAVSQDHAIGLQEGDNGLSGTLILGGERQNALASIVQLYDSLLARLKPSQSFNGWKHVAEFLAHRVHKMIGAHPFFLAKTPEGHSAIKGFARVGKIEVSVFSGHVYTMESVTGWYSITSAGIISKNCRCRMRPVVVFKEG